MSLRALIDAKHRRTGKLPILVGDLTAASAEVATFRAALEVRQRTPTDGQSKAAKAKHAKAVEELRGQLAGALQRQADCVVEIELHALPADEWEGMFGDIEPDDNGDIDLTAIHAPLLAASCVDEELRDVDWWKAQLARPQWTQGDRAVISQTLLELNVYAPTGAPGKG